MHSLEERLIALEIKISHQEASLDTLQELVYDHEKTIAKLEALVARQQKRFDDMVRDGGADIGPADDPPPHY
jgi:SlyX protein